MRWNHHFPRGLGAATGRLLAVLALGGVLAGFCQAEETVFSSNARFRIPYELDPAEIQRLRATEIQLHVSTDQGKSWRNVDAVPPVAGKFTFEAARDGEYWFSVRTISQDGRHHPPGPLAAGLKVYVDTRSPTLGIELEEPRPGTIGLRWIATDDHLDIESLTIEYRISPEEEWETLSVTPEAAGQTSWPVPQGGTVIVRGRVKDRAGNEATEQAKRLVSRTARPQAPAAPARRQSREPIAEGNPTGQQPAAADPFAAAGDDAPVWVPDPTAARGLPMINPHGGGDGRFISQQQGDAAGPTPADPGVLRQEPIREPTTPGAPRRAQVHRVNSTYFQIGYALDDVGSAGIESVELYVTEDDGGQWYHYGADDDGSSPFEVSVPSDGTYGFSIRVRSGAGLTDTPPQPGDAPEMTIAVDRQPPQATLQPPRPGSGEQSGQWIIEWAVSDEVLAEQPVALHYAAGPQGPWQPITGWEADSGRYLWTPGADVPGQVYVRLEARDAAGNISRVDSPGPLVMDASRPTARIIDINPLPKRK